MKNKIINTIVVTFAITLILVMLVGATYAYFVAQAGGTTSRNINVTSNTTDNLVFQISNDISFTVTQADFYENAGNKDGYATGTATLTPNNYTGAATMNYYMYLDLTTNEIEYSNTNTNELPELMLQVFDSSNQLVTLTGLGSQETVGSVTGYDITGVTGIIPLLNNHTISASNNTATIETWRVVITLINHNFNQNDNTGKEVTGTLTMSKEPSTSYVYWNDAFEGDNDSHLFDSSHIPTGTGLSGVYESRLALETAVNNAYNNSLIDFNFTDTPLYNKTTIINGNIEGHETCLWYNNREFCMKPSYWDTNSATTLAKLKSEMQTALGVTLYDSHAAAQAANTNDYCQSDSVQASCVVASFVCIANSYGLSYCYSYDSNRTCSMYGNGSAHCLSD